jgi:hypothetical protein
LVELVASPRRSPEPTDGNREGYPAPRRSAVIRTLREWRSLARTVIERYPRLYLPIARRRGWGEVPTAETEFVIEGYPRSGNTFATAAFGMAKTGPYPRVARHTHAPATVIAAAKRGIPALVLIRRPEDAVLSVVIRQLDLSMRAALRAYIAFYAPLLRYRDGFVVATFDELIQDFGTVTKRVNQRFGTTFGVFEHTKGNAEKALAMIEEEERRRYGEGRALHLKAAYPSQERTRLKEVFRGEYQSERLRTLRERAGRLYRAFTEELPL